MSLCDRFPLSVTTSQELKSNDDLKMAFLYTQHTPGSALFNHLPGEKKGKV